MSQNGMKEFFKFLFEEGKQGHCHLYSILDIYNCPWFSAHDIFDILGLNIKDEYDY